MRKRLPHNKTIEVFKPLQFSSTASGHPLEIAESHTLVAVENREQTIKGIELSEIEPDRDLPSHSMNDHSVRRYFVTSCR